MLGQHVANSDLGSRTAQVELIPRGLVMEVIPSIRPPLVVIGIRPVITAGTGAIGTYSASTGTPTASPCSGHRKAGQCSGQVPDEIPYELREGNRFSGRVNKTMEEVSLRLLRRYARQDEPYSWIVRQGYLA